MLCIKDLNRGSTIELLMLTVNCITVPIGHIWIYPFVATKSNQFRGKEPNATIPMYFTGWFYWVFKRPCSASNIQKRNIENDFSYDEFQITEISTRFHR